MIIVFTHVLSVWHNIALGSLGATCTASQEFSPLHQCERALDGCESAWASSIQGITTWFNIVFPRNYKVSFARFMQRIYDDQSFKEIRLTFSDGFTLDVCHF